MAERSQGRVGRFLSFLVRRKSAVGVRNQRKSALFLGVHFVDLCAGSCRLVVGVHEISRRWSSLAPESFQKTPAKAGVRPSAHRGSPENALRRPWVFSPSFPYHQVVKTPAAGTWCAWLCLWVLAFIGFSETEAQADVQKQGYHLHHPKLNFTVTVQHKR